MHNDQAHPSLDPLAAARTRRLLALGSAGPEGPSAWLHEEVARRMLERLDIIRLQPQAWAHWEPVAGGWQAHQALRARYAQQPCWLVTEHPAAVQALQQAAQPAWWQPARWRQRPAPEHLGVPAAGSVQMVWANMGLHLSAQPQTLMAAWHAALAVDGFVMFSALGPDTVRQLRPIYQALAWGEPSHAYTDMHDWGDMLVHAGFAEPVMDMERITLSFASPERLLQELRGLGRNLHRERFAGLRGRAFQARLLQALAEGADRPEDGAPDRPVLRLDFEIIYGHALKPVPRVRVQAQSAIDLHDMRQILRSQRSESDGR